MITEITKFRERFPDYNDIDDLNLAEKLASKYPEYSDLPNRVRGEKIEEPKGFVEKTISTIPKSALEYGKAVVTPFIHPIETISNIGNVLKGIDIKLRRLEGQEIKPQEKLFEPYAEAAGEFFKERYGGWENVKRTISEDPVGFMGDLSTFLMGAGGTVGKIGPISKVGKIISQTGKIIEPLTAPIKVGGLVTEKILKPVAKGALGFTTRMGPESIGRAMKGTKEFREATLGRISEETIVGEARSGLQVIKDERAADYVQRLSQLKKSTVQLDVIPIKKHLDDLLNRYGVKRNPQGDLDFSRSTFDRKARRDIKAITETVESWGSQIGDNTVIGFDTLKRQLDDFYSPSKNSETFVTSLRNKVKGEIVNQVPEYGQMTKNYAELSDTINSIEKGLALKDKFEVEKAMKRLTSKMRGDSKFSRSLIEMIEEKSGKPIGDLIAGSQAREWYPTTLPGAVMLGGGGLLAYLIKPELLTIAITTSPKIVGMTLNLLGETAYKMGKIPKSEISAFTFQIGRMKRQIAPQESVQYE